MNERRARQIVRQAVSLGVLTPADIDSAGGPGADALKLLISLQRKSLIAPDVVEALEKVVQVHFPDSVRRISAPAQAFEDADTLGPSESEEDTFDTLSGERQEDEDVLLPGSLTADFAAASSFLGAARPATLAPERSDDEDDDGFMDLLLGGGSGEPREEGTLAGAPLGTDSGSTLAGAGELAHEGDTLAPVGDGDPDEGGTLAGAALGPAPAIVTTLPSRSERSVDLGLVPEKIRRQIKEAALSRAIVDGGFADRKKVLTELQKARSRKVLFQEHLIQTGILERSDLRNIGLTIKEIRPACGQCFQLYPDDHPHKDACPNCGFQTQAGEDGGTDYDTSGGTTGGSTSATSQSGSTDADSSVAPGATRRGIEGFPGEGGRFANYDLLRRVAEGGMGVVFKARELTLNRIVALKVMRGGALASKIRRRRFLAEAEAAAALHHPNIVPIHQISEVGGYPFYTMDFVEGSPLDDWVKEGEREAKAIAQLMRVVADAVHHFHLRGIIHRDLKPDNVLVDEDDEPRIIDFGIAKKMTTEFDTEDSWTVEGEVLGTPYYMPPEQAGGRVHEIDTRSDVYALGAILYQLLAGRAPFYGIPPARVVVAIQDDDPTPLRAQNAEVDRDLEAIVNKAMAKERERRYQSALELAQDLQRFVNEEPILARPAGLGYRLKKLARRHRAAATASVAATLLLIGLGIYSGLQRRARQIQIEQMLSKAREAPLEEQPELFSSVLTIDPESGEARAELDRARTEKKAQEELRLAEERRKADVAEQTLAREREQQQIRLLQEAERARKEGAEASARKAQERARGLLAQAKLARTPLEGVGFLNDALVLVPEAQGSLGAELGAGKVDRCLRLAQDALQENQAGLSRFWLNEATKLQSAATRQADVDRLRAALEDLTSARHLHEEAKQLIAQEQWQAARQKLKEAQARGVAETLLGSDLELAETQCAASGSNLLDQARGLLRDERPEQALTKAREGAAFLEGPSRESAQAVIAECAEALARRTTVEAHRFFERPEGRPQALTLLANAVRALSGTKVGEALQAELSQRRWLAASSFDSLCYVPAISDLGLKAFFVGAREVTNREFKEFVSAGGYADESLWDEAAKPLLASLVDSTPGRRRPGPRSWRNGGYGDEANAQRPVRGVTWFEARAYARWLRKRTKLPWRLPRSEEFEAAAGWDLEGRRMRTYPWGEEFDAGALSQSALPNPVGTRREDRSYLGLLDAGGNVSEWVLLAGDVGARPGLKGAPYLAADRMSRHQARIRTTGTPPPSPPQELVNTIGFRLALDPPVDR